MVEATRGRRDKKKNDKKKVGGFSKGAKHPTLQQNVQKKLGAKIRYDQVQVIYLRFCLLGKTSLGIRPCFCFSSEVVHFEFRLSTNRIMM